MTIALLFGVEHGGNNKMRLGDKVRVDGRDGVLVGIHDTTTKMGVKRSYTVKFYKNWFTKLLNIGTTSEDLQANKIRFLK